MSDLTRTNFATGKTHKENGNILFKDGKIKEGDLSFYSNEPFLKPDTCIHELVFVWKAICNVALKEYNLALLYLNGLDNSAMSAIIGSNGVSSLSDAEKTEIVATIKACHANMAACYIKNENYTKAIDFCDRVLKVDSNNTKAMYRKGHALFKMNELEPSLKILMSAVKLAPNDVLIRDQITQVKTKITELEIKSRNELRNNLKM
ncbi:hypothetical protein BATDEDRAFT_23836 [Batrachochytrium dendrobatidis JAM81]|uniref:peptidylprolyl isomerase n=1 Tax=Batrachochytrium dendrobatidis (strain JAM81 / FGSC 10211) TaxID=684364 RepID=F4P0C7_BATDJ|nr:uncharacterized protein BATDEDRAFT_23836 [Batrachochytrium dendrobatidis JAM81]EGF81423.1 hypothetical protein BATDEDRAFT_23836 [Batrachochytrium dendrobatidis JAM81]|eukprot:XP_006677852.1 hypothetical protein BATDEDRAFT_23836 [Batrachochytrium dendrobatidis JAM81]